MKTQEKPKIVQQIEALMGGKFKLQLAPKNPSLLGGLMAFKSNTPKYAVDDKGRLIGLNLAASKLDDFHWQKIVSILSSQVQQLQALNLNENDLSDFVLPKGMKSLQYLDLGENQIKEFSLPDEVIDLKELHLKDNPLSTPPPEIVQQGSTAVLAWFASFKKTESKKEFFLKEIKVLLVGEGLAGKTSLLKQIKGLPFDEHENQTHGVNVESIKMGEAPMFKPFNEVKDVVIHLWDFGGQEIMHSSHQFFLTHRSIYVFVLDSRTDNKKDYWLRHIQKFGGQSPAIVAINKMDKNKTYSLEESTINSKYPFVGNRFIKMSCKSGLGQKQFAQTLAELIPQTPLFNTPISESWLKIKNQLESETSTQRYINRQRFIDICKENNEEDPKAQETLLNYLNSLGVVLHFQGLALQEFFVLDPHWVTIGVYKIINSPSILNGILQEKQIDFILNREDQKIGEYDPSKEKTIEYNSSEQLYLVGIMMEFELLYQFKKGHYLVPDLLPKELPKSIPFDRKDAVEFVMEYDFLPPNVMSSFIIHMKNDIHDLQYLWRTGAYFSNQNYNCEALVTATADMDQQRISILVNGDSRRKREYFSIIRHGICSINDKFYDLKVTEKMPVPGHQDIEIDYQELLGLEKMKEDRLVIGRLGKAFSVSNDFLDKISTKEDRQQERSQGKISLPIEHHKIHESLKRIERITGDTEKNTRAIIFNQEQQQKYLDTLLVFAESHRQDIDSLFTKIDDSKIGKDDLNRINDLLEQQMDRYIDQLPPSNSMYQKWKETKELLPHVPDSKWKFKLKIPLIFGEFEKELSWDLKAALKLTRREIRAYRKGEKTFKQLFVEDDDDD